MPEQIRIAVIYGSAREGRLCDRVVSWVSSQLWDDGRFAVHLIDPAELGLSGRHEESDGDAVAALRQHMAEAEAFIIVTPEYNHSYPAALKLLIDSVGREWQSKPVGFVSYGGISGGLRAVEHLRAVFAELHAVTMRDTVSFANAWERFDEEGRLHEPGNAPQAVKRLLSHLEWWAGALRNARNALPYHKIAI